MSAVADDPHLLVSTGWLADRMDDPNLRVLDASWYLPGTARDPKAEYAAGHIPGAQFFDIDEVADLRSPLPHMAPPPEKFVTRMRALGIADGHQVVVYDGAGIFSAARVWWTFRLMGKRDIAVLDGGLPKWKAEGRPVVRDSVVQKDRHLTVAVQPGLVTDVTAVARAAKLGTHTILDARPAGRFTGEVPEPRPGLRQGHIPGSANVPFTTLMNPDGTMKSPTALRSMLREAGIDLRKPVITTCGSGISASTLALALERIGKTDWSVYDGSWAEWGAFDDLPVATGPA
jgi:thiosulfate/3-mercaptopyruvate sulfurtransferase